MKRIGLLAPLALIVLVNVLVLAGVRYNRSGDADAVMTLTERELRLQTNSKENSGVSLNLTPHPDYNKWSEASPWFDQKKLEEIGFDCSEPVNAKNASHHYGKALPRKTYVVLEYEGLAWESWLAHQEERLKTLEFEAAQGHEGRKSLDAERKRFTWEKESGSRLFNIDAGNDAARLRTRYPDRKRYIITSAKVRLHLLPADSATERHTPILSGYVDDILTGTIHVPRDRQGILAALKPDVQYSYYDGVKKSANPRYRVTLKYGRRYEPWVEEVAAK